MVSETLSLCRIFQDVYNQQSQTSHWVVPCHYKFEQATLFLAITTSKPHRTSPLRLPNHTVPRHYNFQLPVVSPWRLATLLSQIRDRESCVPCLSGSSPSLNNKLSRHHVWRLPTNTVTPPRWGHLHLTAEYCPSSSFLLLHLQASPALCTAGTAQQAIVPFWHTASRS